MMLLVGSFGLFEWTLSQGGSVEQARTTRSLEYLFELGHVS